MTAKKERALVAAYRSAAHRRAQSDLVFDPAFANCAEDVHGDCRQCDIASNFDPTPKVAYVFVIVAQY